MLFVLESMFASGSIDGTIILWKTDNLLPFRYFNSITEDYQGKNKTFPYSVQHIACVEAVSCLCHLIFAHWVILLV